MDTQMRLFYLFKILVIMTTISTPKNPENDHVYAPARGTLQWVGCCALGQLSQSPSWYLSMCQSWAEPTAYSWILASK